MNKKKLRMIIDISMTILLFILMAYHITGQKWHEIAGTGMFVLFIVHNVLNRKWYGALFKGKYSVNRAVQTAINLLLAAAVICLMFSGMAMSGYVFKFISLPVGMATARSIHMTAAYSAYLLMSMHIGLHYVMMIGKLSRRVKALKSPWRQIITVFNRLAAIIIAVYGLYAMHERKIFDYIFGKVGFAFFDYEEKPVAFFIDYAAIMGLMIFIMYYLQKFFSVGVRKRFSLIGQSIREHKKRSIVIGVISLVVIVLAVVFGKDYIKRHFVTVEVNRNKATVGEKVDMGDMNGVVIYFTRVGNTDFKPNVDAVSGASLMLADGALVGNSQLLAEMISKATGFPKHAIIVKNKYSSGYNATVSEAREEMKGDKLAEISELPDLSEYDTVFLVYPLWWWTLPLPVETFLRTTDLSGKTIYSVVTHGGSGFGDAISDTEKYTDAVVSDIKLSVYDMDVATSLDKVTDWLRSVREER